MVDVGLIQEPQTLLAAATTFRQAMFGLPGGVTPLENWVEEYLQPGRVYGAWLAGTLAGTTNSFSGEITLPGGNRVAHAAVTHVGVLPQFSRRGVLRALFQRQLNDFHQQQVAVATLRASQGTIYPRFGFGIASWFNTLSLDKRELGAIPASAARIELLPAAQAWEQQVTIVHRFPERRAGTLTRWPQWWAMQQHRLRHSSHNHYVALLIRNDEPQAFVRYHAQPDENWLYSRDRTLVVDDLHAPDADGYQALIGYLLQLDITRHITFASRPTDDPLPLWVDNPRAVTISAQRDESWLRIIDVATTLNARQWGAEQPVTLAIHDPLLPHNHGCWQLGPQGVRRSTAAADASLSIDALATLLLGGSRVWQLIFSKKIELHNPQAAGRLERLFAVTQLPWAGLFF